MVGNLMGDFMKGVDINQLPPSVALGIQNHQMVTLLPIVIKVSAP